MRADRKQKEKKQKKKQGIKINGYKLLSIVYLLVAVLFFITLVRVNVLPTLYLGVLAAVMTVMSALLIAALRRKPKIITGKDGETHTKKKVFSTIIAIIMIVVLSVGNIYLGGTLDFFDKITGGKQTQHFYVLTKADSQYDKLKDIEGETVGLMVQSSDAYTMAQESLQKKVEVEFKTVGNYDVLATSLINNESNVIFINSAYYDMAVEEIDGFSAETTKILEEIKVVVEADEIAKNVNVTEDSFNMYISGIDTTGSIGNISRSDVNMIMTVNPSTKTILLTSIPRDCYVKLASIGEMDKLTHSGLYGIEETTSTIENLFGIEINYYARVNFSTVVNLVDILGGINVKSDYAFSAKGLEGQVYSYVVGDNYLYGQQALAFARERYSFAAGDGQRVKNQQAVIKGVIEKVTGSSAILTSYNSILNSLENNFETNMTQKEITSLVKMQLGDMTGWTIKQQSITGTGGMTSVYSIPNARAYVLYPDQDSIVAATLEIQAVMNEG